MNKMIKNKNSKFHSKNKHKSDYDFAKLCNAYEDLKPFVFENKFKTTTIDFANPDAVKALNKALLLTHYNVKYWEFPDENLCPPIPGRVDYIHHLADLLKSSGLTDSIKILDIGTGATCIYPLLGTTEYAWQFVASDVDKASLQNAQQIINKNSLEDSIELRPQGDASRILKGIIKPSDKFSAMLCNPPFFKSESEADEATNRKLHGLGKIKNKGVRNFSGRQNELCYKGGEKAFLHNYLYESSLFKNQCYWFTTLVSKKELVKSMQDSLKKLNAASIKVIPMHQGNKITRIIAWTFLTKEKELHWENSVNFES